MHFIVWAWFVSPLDGARWKPSVRADEEGLCGLSGRSRWIIMAIETPSAEASFEWDRQSMFSHWMSANEVGESEHPRFASYLPPSCDHTTSTKLFISISCDFVWHQTLKISFNLSQERDVIQCKGNEIPTWLRCGRFARLLPEISTRILNNPQPIASQAIPLANCLLQV